MQVDLREKIKNDKMMRELPKNHREIFEQRLKNELPLKTTSNYTFMKVAASIVLLLSLGFAGYQFYKPQVPQEIVQKEEVPDNKINSIAYYFTNYETAL